MWSPDGSKLAFTADGDSGGSGVHVVQVDGSGLRLIARGGFTPVWAPSVPRIAFISQEVRDGRPLARVAIVRGGRGAISVLLTDDHVDSQPAWSADGSAPRLRAERRAPPNGSLHGRFERRPDREVLSRTIPIGNVAWVGRDRALAFDSGGIWTVSSAGLQGYGGSTPEWSLALSSDRKRIAYVRGRSIAVVGIAGGRIRTVLRIPREYVYDGPFWIARGRLAFSSEAAGGQRLRPLGRRCERRSLAPAHEHARQRRPPRVVAARAPSPRVRPQQLACPVRVDLGLGREGGERYDESPSAGRLVGPNGRRLAFSSRRVIYSLAQSTADVRSAWSRGESPVCGRPAGGRSPSCVRPRVLVVDLGTHAVRTPDRLRSRARLRGRGRNGDGARVVAGRQGVGRNRRMRSRTQWLRGRRRGERRRLTLTSDRDQRKVGGRAQPGRPAGTDSPSRPTSTHGGSSRCCRTGPRPAR